MDAVGFVFSVESLTNSDRVRRAVELGKLARSGDKEAHDTIAALAASAFPYERHLALLTVFGSGDGNLVCTHLVDVSRRVRRRAASLVAIACDDTQALNALHSVVEKPTVGRIVGALLRARRRSVVDRFLHDRMAHGRSPAVVDLIGYGSTSVVEKYIGDVVEGGGATAWTRLFCHHPHFVANWIKVGLQHRSTLDVRERSMWMSHLPTLADKAPNEAFDLVKTLLSKGETIHLLHAAIQALVQKKPAEVFDLLRELQTRESNVRAPGPFGGIRLETVAHRLGAERLAYLVENAWSTLRDKKHGKRWFYKLSNSDRTAVVEAFLQKGRAGWGGFLFRYAPLGPARDTAFQRWSHATQDKNGRIELAELEWLPADLRAREATRHLEQVQTLRTKPHERIVYAQLLPFAEAKKVLAPFLGHPEGEERALAQHTLISTVRLDRAALPEALANIKARKFEQDPVRFSMIDALAGIAKTAFLPSHLEEVTVIAEDALAAADLSGRTAEALERLIVRLFPIDGAWGARMLARVLATRGSISTWRLGDGLTPDEAKRLAPAFAQLARDWATRERAGAILTIAHSVGIRLHLVPPLLDALETLSRDLPFAGVAAGALALIWKHDRKRFRRLAVELLKADPSYVLIPEVARFLSFERQDLLTKQMLAAAPMTGRFATGKTNWLIDFQGGYGRWTERQQNLFASTLLRFIGDKKADVPSLYQTIHLFLQLPFADAEPFLPFAADPRQPVREIAVRGLPWLDAQQGVGVLIDALGDDRARWAIYALRKVFSELRPERVLAELRKAPTTKVTVAKEVVRLLGELGSPEAYQELLKLDRPDVHRDVRIALLRALWDHLDREETWKVFERALSDPDWVVASKLADVPTDRLSTQAEARMGGLIASILARPEPEARIDLLTRVRFLPIRDTSRTLFRRLIDHLQTPDHEEALLAFHAVLNRMTADETLAVSQAIANLVDRRRHLLAFIDALLPTLRPHGREHHRRIAEHLLSALEPNPLTVASYVHLGSHLWDHKALVSALERLSTQHLLYHDAMSAAITAVDKSVAVELVERALRGSPDPQLRRLALVALVRAAAPKDGWTPARRARLVEFQNDPSPAVAGPASFVFPP